MYEITKMNNKVYIRPSLVCICILHGTMTTDEHSRAGGRAYSVREVSKAGYLFRFDHQSDTAIAVHETHSWLSNWQHFTGQKLSNGLEEHNLQQ
jgi:hypothetical protein